MTRRFPTPARHVIVFGFFAVLSGFLFFAVEPAFAITIVPLCARAASLQTPSLDCVLETFRSVASLIVGITGSFALLMFVYGGFMLLTSAGVESRVTTGKTILKNAMIGLILVFTAGYLIDYGIKALTGGRAITVDATNPNKCNNGRGMYATVKGRGEVCQTPCPAMRPLYDCVPTGTGSVCNADYLCPNNTQCCVVMDMQTPAARETGAPIESGGAH